MFVFFMLSLLESQFFYYKTSDYIQKSFFILQRVFAA